MTRSILQPFKRILSILLVIYAVLAMIASFDGKSEVYAQERPKIGLVLSGGGAKGLAHIGVLKVLGELGIEVDYIAGTSMGSIVGGFYAIGYDVSRIEQIALDMPWADVLTDKIMRSSLSIEEKFEESRYVGTFPIRKLKIGLPRGLIAGQKASAMLARLTWPVHHIEDFNDFLIPFSCVAADIETGEQVVIDSGNLAEAIRASMSIPSAFNPVEIDGRLLVDGSIVNIFPASVVVDMGADIIIGVDVGSPLRTREELDSFVAVIDQLLNFQSVPVAEKQHELCDILILPDLNKYNALSFGDVDSLIARGEQAARLALPQLRALADSLKRYPGKKSRFIPAYEVDSLYIHAIEIEGLNHVSEKLVLGKLQIKDGEWIRQDAIEKAVERIYGSQFFERVTYRMVLSPEGTTLIIRVTEKTADMFKFGLRYDSEMKASVLLNTTFHNIVNESSKLSLNVKLGEYSGYEGSYFIHTGWDPGVGIGLDAGYNVFDIYTYEDEQLTAKYELSDFTADLYVKTIISNSFAFGTGVQTEFEERNPKIAPLGSMKESARFLNYYGYFEMDTFDRGVFPRKGAQFRLEFRYVSDAMYEDEDAVYSSFQRYTASFSTAAPVSGRVTLRTGGFLGTLRGDAIHPSYAFSLGGFNPFRQKIVPLSGLDYMQYTGVHAYMARAGIQYERWTDRFFTLQVEAGNTSTEFNDLFKIGDIVYGLGLTFGINSPIGPLEYSVIAGNKITGIRTYINIGYRF